MNAQPLCPQCAAAVAAADRFCEGCGSPLAPVRRIAIPRHDRIPAGPCADCGNPTFDDDYCTVCGHRRTPPDRDEIDFDGMFLITDRGLEHVRNEDAAAAGILPGVTGRPPHVIAVAVCDGVSSSDDAHTAATAAAAAGVEAMLAALAASARGKSAVLAGLAAAARAAAAAGAGADPSSAPSCTYTAAAVTPDRAGGMQIAVGNVGDSRIYWIPEIKDLPTQLTIDDSLSQELMAAGAAADSAAVQRGAHTLTRWLGADADAKPWADSNVHTFTATGPGVLLLCSDGLWNYLPDAGDIARFCTGTDPAAAARALVDYALDAGGQDNVTVAVIPIGGLHEFG